jgi:hypothetical protein
MRRMEHPPYALARSCISKALVVLPTNCPTTAVKELCDHQMIAAAGAAVASIIRVVSSKRSLLEREMGDPLP